MKQNRTNRIFEKYYIFWEQSKNLKLTICGTLAKIELKNQWVSKMTPR